MVLVLVLVLVLMVSSYYRKYKLFVKYHYSLYASSVDIINYSVLNSLSEILRVSNVEV